MVEAVYHVAILGGNVAPGKQFDILIDWSQAPGDFQSIVPAATEGA
jgi:hypothetical protein